MRNSLFDLLACPSCRHAQFEFLSRTDSASHAGNCLGDVGVLICTYCERWYPIESGIVRMLPDNIRSRASDESFISRHFESFRPELSERLRNMQRSWNYSEGDANSMIAHFEVAMGRKGKSRTKNRNHRLKFQEILRGVKAGRGGACLEVGCGNGSHAAALLEHCPEIYFVAL